jgi:hypothetical protein
VKSIILCVALLTSSWSIGSAATYTFTNRVVTGYSLVAVPINVTPTNSLDYVFACADEFDTFFEWNEDRQSFGEEPPYLYENTNAHTYFLGAWSPNSSAQLPVGVAALYQTGYHGGWQCVLTGTVRPPTLPVSFVRGTYRPLARQEPGPGTYENIVGLSPDPGSKFIRVDRTPGYDSVRWITNVFNGTQWSLGSPHVEEGEGALIYFPVLLRPLILTNLAVSFANGGTFQMDVVGASNASIRVEYSLSITSTNWVAATNCTANSGKFTYSTNGVGPVGTRFYRARYVF